MRYSQRRNKVTESVREFETVGGVSDGDPRLWEASADGDWSLDHCKSPSADASHSRMCAKRIPGHPQVTDWTIEISVVRRQRLVKAETVVGYG